MQLVVESLTVRYRGPTGPVTPIDGLDVRADSGQLVLIMGPSGSGKTSLLSCLAGILTPVGGRILLGDTDVTALDAEGLTDHRRRQVGVVFQMFNLVGSLTAAENVAVPLWAAGSRRRDGLERAAVLLEQVGLADRMHHRPGQLSGGQQQRVAIGRALAHDPVLLIADEPTAHLDTTQAEVVLTILRQLAAPGRLVLVSTHDHRLLPVADDVIDLTPEQPLATTDELSRRLDAGAVIFRQGEPSDLVYVVTTGEVELIRETDGSSQGELLRGCGPGEYFGEMGPLLGFPRSATARARTDCEVKGYSVHAFRETVGDVELPSSWGALAKQRQARRG